RRSFRLTPPFLFELFEVLAPAIAEDAAKEAERAQKEEQRIVAADLSSQYQRVKAGIDVDIANVNLAIADLKVSLAQLKARPETTAKLARADTLIRDRADLRIEIRQIKLQIEEIKLEIISADEDYDPTRALIITQELKINIADLNTEIETFTADVIELDQQIGSIARGDEYLNILID
ncbi:unnamed protein product, partial [marine sediment metagenome]